MSASNGTQVVVQANAQAEKAVLELGAVYWQLSQESAENFMGWKVVVKKWAQAVVDLHRKEGFVTAPLYHDALLARLEPVFPASDPSAHIDVVRALLTDYSQPTERHILVRQAWGGNVVFEITGPTGMGKSSLAIYIANAGSAIDAARINEYLVFDLSELPSKLATKKPGETVVIDEYVRQSGDGSRTALQMIANLEDQIRASQVNLLWLSPQKQDHSTSQAEFEVVFWNRERQETRCLVWCQGRPRGYVTIPWAPPELWAAYQPWKTEKVQRALSGQFRETTAMARIAMHLFAMPEYVQYMLKFNKPKKSDFEESIDFFYAVSLPSRQVGRLASFMHKICYSYDRLKDDFPTIFERVQPVPGWHEVAKICYQE